MFAGNGVIALLLASNGKIPTPPDLYTPLRVSSQDLEQRTCQLIVYNTRQTVHRMAFHYVQYQVPIEVCTLPSKVAFVECCKQVYLTYTHKW